MAETGTSVDTTPQTEEQLQQVANKSELDRMMSIHLNNGLEPAPPNPENIEITGPAVTPSEPIPATFDTIRDKFNYNSAEDAIKEIEELRALRATPPKPEFKFENTESEKAFLALTKGDRKEALKIFAEQERIENLIDTEVNKDNAADIIKLGIYLKNKDLSQQEIEFQYKENYLPPKEPTQKLTETEDEFNERHDEWKEVVERVEMKRVIAAKMAKPELELAKSKIVFPDVDKPVDEGYMQYQKMLEDGKKQEAATIEEYKKFTPKTLETKVPFIDEPNKINFEFQHEPSGEDFKKVMDIATDFNLFWDLFKKPDGTPDREGFAQAIYFGLNRNKVIMEAIKQTKNATIKTFIPDNDGGVQRQFPQSQQPNELDEMMRLQGIKRA